MPGEDARSSAAGSDGRLACGTPLDDLFAQVADGRPPADPVHQRGCRYCQAALAELEELWAPVVELTAEDVRAPAGLLDAVLARIRELASDPWYVTMVTTHGNVRVAARVVGALARVAARQVPGVDLALGRAVAATVSDEAVSDESVSDESGTTPPGVEVDVDIVVDYGAPLHRVADVVRRRISADLDRHTGIRASAVNVTIVDVRALPAT